MPPAIKQVQYVVYFGYKATWDWGMWTGRLYSITDYVFCPFITAVVGEDVRR